MEVVMHTRGLLLLILSTLLLTQAFSQGWQFVGPDSANWQNVRRVSGKWISPASYRLAAATGNKGVALFSSAGQWSYRFTTWYDPFWGTGMGYYYFDFSPWEQDSAFLGYAYFYVEPAFYIQKISLTSSPLQSGVPVAGCWITALGLLFPGNADSTVYASVCGLHRSTNRGMQWDTISGHSYAASFSLLLALNKTRGNVFYKSDSPPYRAVLFRSTNRGRNWDSIFTANAQYFQYGNSESPYSVVAAGDTILVGVRSAVGDTLRTIGIFRSSNDGATWAHVYSNGRIVGIVESQHQPGTLYAAGEEGIIRSTDFGLTWQPYNNALPTRRLTSVIISPYGDTLFVSSETHGVLKVWNYVTGINEAFSRPDIFELYQNYPNPFNPTTTIRFQIPTSSFVTLKVFDLLGREVATLVDEVMTPGSYERTFNGERLASGVYLYQLKAGAFVQTKKLLLLR
jgi:hypothetical protein